MSQAPVAGQEHQAAQGEVPKRVVYLLGAGASHASAKALGSSQGILMRDLTDEIARRVREHAERYGSSSSVARLANEVIGEDTDVEQVITFLDESGSGEHQRFANDLRKIFEEVLRERLGAIRTELETVPTGLYAALIDMYEVQGITESLRGILTLNYDVFLEHAIEKSLGFSVDYGISIDNRLEGHKSIRLLKLHGSFGWQNVWPIELSQDASIPLWIPPGIQKAKGSYPFNLLWGMARELLDCDILRIVGCNLGTNDWDLVSMLFSTQHVHKYRKSYEIEIIDKPGSAERIKSRFPYLRAKSLLELEGLGEQIVSEMIGGAPRPYRDLPEPDQKRAAEKANGMENPLLYWLKQKAEAMYQDLASLKTEKGYFMRILESY